MLDKVANLALAAYILLEFARSPALYRALERQLAAGRLEARTTFYRKTLVFEVATALWALLLAWHSLDPAALGLDQAPLVSTVRAVLHETNVSHWIGFVGGALTAGLVLWRLTRRRPAPAQRRARLMPDFRALLPQSRAERWWFAAVAVSAGVCEEIVFRGWLLGFLHDHGLGGTALLVVAAAVFGLGHLYQGVPGVVATGWAGALFIALYVVSGSLLLPIACHVLMDLRFVLVPRQLAPAGPRHREADTRRAA